MVTGWIGAGTGVVGASFAALTYLAWRRRKRAERRMELAAEALPRLRQLVEIVDVARYRSVPEPEVLDRAGRADEPEDIRRARDAALAFRLRAGRHKDLFASFSDDQKRAGAVFGGELDAPYGEIATIVAELHAAAARLAKRGPADPPDAATLHNLERMLRAGAAGQDPVGARLAAAAARIEQRLKKELA